MISLTLNFNSVGQMHDALAAMLAGARPQAAEQAPIAIGEIRVVHTEAPQPAAPVQAQEEPAKAPKPPKAAKPAPTPPAPAAAPQEPAQPAPAAASPSEPAADVGVAYEQVSRAITEAGKVDRARVVALLAKFGAKRGTELKPEQYEAFLGELA